MKKKDNTSYIKKQVLEGLKDFKKGRYYSLSEMKSLSKKWKLESQKMQSDIKRND